MIRERLFLASNKILDKSFFMIDLAKIKNNAPQRGKTAFSKKSKIAQSDEFDGKSVRVRIELGKNLSSSNFYSDSG